MNSLIESLLDILFPPRCPACSLPVQSGQPASLCHPCLQNLFPLEPPLCDRCGFPLLDQPPPPLSDLPSQGSSPPSQANQKPHFPVPKPPDKDTVPPAPSLPQPSSCERCASSLPFPGRLRSGYAYAGTAQLLLTQFKYRPQPALARPLHLLLRRSLADIEWQHRPYHLLTVVPLHPQRLRERGFNQSLLLAQGISSWWKGALVADLLQRSRQTAHQVGLGPEERSRNLQASIQLNPRYADSLQQANILLIDDVFTTGATAQACARPLLKAGAQSVDVLTFARTL